MKTTSQISTALLTIAISCLPVWAEQDNAGQVQAPSASAVVDAVSPVASEPAVINHVVYLAKLPTPAELIKGAEVQGIKIARIDQTTDRMVVAYEYSGGRTVTFAYTLLTAVASYPVPAVSTGTVPAPAGTVVYSQPAPATQVVYAQPGTVYYAPQYAYASYNPAWDLWAPLAIGVGIGWYGGYYGGHGGYYGGHGGYYGGHGGGYGGHGHH